MADRFVARLARELELWTREGLVSAGQAERILARYPRGSGWLARPVALFGLIGGALMVAGLALVVAHNWAAIPRVVKIGGIVVMLGTAHRAGLALRERGHPQIGEGLFVVGGGLLLVAIALVGQIYNLPGRMADALLMWWPLLLPAAYALPTMGLAGLAWLGSGAWFVAALLDPTTALGAAARASGLFPWVAVPAAGLILLALGVLHGEGRWRPAGRALEWLGLGFVMGGLLPLGFSWEGWLRPGRPGAVPTAALLLVLALLAVLAAARRLPAAPGLARRGVLVAWLVTLAYLATVYALMALRTGPLPVRPLRWASWLLVLGLAIVLILAGARWGRVSWINAGVLGLGVHAVARYVDLIGTMLHTSVLFLSAGLLVLLLGLALERLRRRMTARATAGPAAP